MATYENQLAFGRQLNSMEKFAFDQRTSLTFGTTPGGTFYATTPRGTRITYDRDFLITCQNSPHAMTPPRNLPIIPGVTVANEKAASKSVKTSSSANKSGSRIVYDRDFLLKCRKSPLAMVPPKGLLPELAATQSMKVPAVRSDSVGSGEEAQFELEM